MTLNHYIFLTSIICTAKIAHYTHFSQSCSTHKSTNNSTNSNTVEQNERLFQIDTSCVLICLFFLDSNHLNCQDTYDTQWIQYRSSSRTQTLSVTIQNLLCQRYTFVYSSTFIIFHSQNLMATCCLNIWPTCQLLTDSIGTLSK